MEGDVDVTLTMTLEESQAVISAIAMQNPLIKKLADQVTQQTLAQPNGLDQERIQAARAAAAKS